MNRAQTDVRENSLLSPFFIFFLIHSSQTGIGMLSFQRDIAKHAEQDAWISVLVGGFTLHIILFLMFKLLDQSPNRNLISLHKEYFGKIIGNALSVLFLLYFLLLMTTVVDSYVEIINVWAFSSVRPWEFTLIISIVIFLIVSGGFRVITGIAFWSILIPIILFFVLGYTLKYSHFSNLLPLFGHDIKDILKSSKEATVSFLGFETLFLFYPFVKKSSKTKMWAHGGLLFTTFSYVLITIITFAYFSGGQLEHIIWPTLVMTKIVQVPFIDRFEYIFIFCWLLVVLPPICLCIWSISRGMKEMFNFTPSYTLIGILILLNITPILFNERDSIEMIKTLASLSGFYILLLYIPILYLFVLIVNKFFRKKAN